MAKVFKVKTEGWLAKKLTEREGLKEQLSIAQASEVVKCMQELVADRDDGTQALLVLLKKAAKS